jgi:mannose-6-phosphate isomerase-like protein (cupin superfamily)
MARYGDLYVNDVTGDERRDRRAGGGPARRRRCSDEPMLVHLRVSPGGAVSGEHLHPAPQERFRVLDGVLETKVDGARRTLRTGEEITVPAGLWHDWWNATGQPVDVLVELSPPSPRFDLAIATG